MSIFMLGLPLGNAGCAVDQRNCSPSTTAGNRRFIVALIPGLLCALGAYMIHEPKRGGTELHNIGAAKRDGSPYALVLSIPTMRWIIVSGALHNFNMYAIGGFLTPLVIRVHGLDPAVGRLGDDGRLRTGRRAGHDAGRTDGRRHLAPPPQRPHAAGRLGHRVGRAADVLRAWAARRRLADL